MPRTRRSIPAVLAGLAALGATAFAPAAPRTVADSTPDIPSIELQSTEGGTPYRTVDGLADRSGFLPGDDLRDRLTWFDRTRRVMAARGIETVAATDGECVEGCDEGEEPAETAYAFTTPVDDLDGDGTDEVLVMEVRFTEEDVTSSTTARSGADGTVLWSVEDEGMFWASTVPDLDGDGRTDLLGGSWSIMFVLTGSCTDPLGVQCTFGEIVEESLTLTGYSGATATPIGSHQLDGSWTFEVEDTSVGNVTGRTGTSELRITVEGGFFGSALVDLEGNGTHGLVHESFDATFTQRTTGTINDTPLGWADAVLVETAENVSGAVQLVDLAAGSTETIIETTDALPYSWVVAGNGADRILLDRFPDAGSVAEGCVVVDPVGGECGDDRSLPTSGANDAAPTRTLYDADLEPVWEVPLPATFFFPYAAGGDLDGDGTDDLFDVGFDEDAFEEVVTAVSGATGDSLWTAPVGMVALDGDHLLGARVKFGHEEIQVDGVVLDPATGAARTQRTLASQTIPEEGDFAVASVGVMVTAVTIGSLDLVTDVFTAAYEAEEECDVWEGPDGSEEEYCYDVPGELVSSEADLVGVEGSDLTELVHLEDPSLVLLDVTELDGDAATAELVVMETDRADWFAFGPVRALRLDTSQLWELTPSEFAVGPVASNDGTTDILVEDVDAGTMSVRDGADLTVRWSAPLPGGGSGGGAVVVTVE